MSAFHYGVDYANGFVSEFQEDRAEAFREYQALVAKGIRGVRLVRRRVGPWHPCPQGDQPRPEGGPSDQQ